MHASHHHLLQGYFTYCKHDAIVYLDISSKVQCDLTKVSNAVIDGATCNCLNSDEVRCCRDVYFDAGCNMK